MSLQGKKVFVIGGSSGIGLATAQMASEAGATVVIGGRTPEKLDAAAKSFDDSAETVVLDVTSDDSVAAACAKVGAVDHVLVTPPISGAVGALRDLDVADAQAGLNAKFWGAVRVAKYTDINEGGSLTVLSGQMARRPRPGLLTGAVANAAVDVLCRGLAVEMAPIRVNAISPGIIDTALHARLPDDQRQAMYKASAERLPVGRVGQPEDIGSMVLEVMQNGFLTGAVIEVDGGAVALG